MRVLFWFWVWMSSTKRVRVCLSIDDQAIRLSVLVQDMAAVDVLRFGNLKV
jgi:hypothetical protein